MLPPIQTLLNGTNALFPQHILIGIPFMGTSGSYELGNEFQSITQTYTKGDIATLLLTTDPFVHDKIQEKVYGERIANDKSPKELSTYRSSLIKTKDFEELRKIIQDCNIESYTQKRVATPQTLFSIQEEPTDSFFQVLIRIAQRTQTLTTLYQRQQKQFEEYMQKIPPQQEYFIDFNLPTLYHLLELGISLEKYEHCAAIKKCVMWKSNFARTEEQRGIKELV
jgi:hypothetical protein